MTTLRAALACLLFAACASEADQLADPPTSANGPATVADSPPSELFPGADGKPSAPFGDFSYAHFAGYRLAPSQPVDLEMYSPAPTSGPWSPDYAALEALARYHGSNGNWCWFDSFVTGNGANCCASDAGFNPSLGLAGGAPIVSCGQPPTSWNVGPALSSVGLRGLHVARPLTAPELRAELVNGRPVLARSGEGPLGSGALLVIAGWSPIDSGGDRFLLVREGLSFQWQAYVDIAEGRADWLKSWTDSWYRISARADGCVPSFDSACPAPFAVTKRLLSVERP